MLYTTVQALGAGYEHAATLISTHSLVGAKEIKGKHAMGMKKEWLREEGCENAGGGGK
jgi:hypothetical protein